MLRILFNAMQEVNGEYWYQGDLFTGIGFFIDEENHVQGYQLNAGIIGDSYRPISQLTKTELPQLNLTGALSDYDLILHEDRLLTGIGYEFSDEFCIHEAYIQDGIVNSDAYWNANGLLLQLSLSSKSFGEIYEWYENGERKSVDISTSSSFTGHLSYGEDGVLHYINSNRGFFDALDEIAKAAAHFPFKDRAGLLEQKYANHVTLSGGDMNDKNLATFMHSECFRHVESLKLLETKAAHIDLSVLSELKEVHVVSRDSVQIDFAKNLKIKNPRLTIKFNGGEILV